MKKLENCSLGQVSFCGQGWNQGAQLTGGPSKPGEVTRGTGIEMIAWRWGLQSDAGHLARTHESPSHTGLSLRERGEARLGHCFSATTTYPGKHGGQPWTCVGGWDEDVTEVLKKLSLLIGG